MTALVEPVGAAVPSHGPLTPEPFRVVGRAEEVGDVVTLSVEPCGDRPLATAAPGQFHMLTAFGVGEVAVSVAGNPADGGPVEHAVRDVGAVTHALCTAPVGTVIGVRGPFGRGWDVGRIPDGPDVVVVAGGIGLAPLRGAVRELVARQRDGRGRVVVVSGARSPEQVLFAADLDAWRRAGPYVVVTVDVAGPAWDGPVGVVTTILPDLPVEWADAWALTCGPEIMMRFVARGLVERGVDPCRILVSLERNMQCGVGLCGHCQLGPLLVCRDGPVVPYGGTAERLLLERGR